MLHGGMLFFILGGGPKEIRYDVHYPHFTMANPTVFTIADGGLSGYEFMISISTLCLWSRFELQMFEPPTTAVWSGILQNIVAFARASYFPNCFLKFYSTTSKRTTEEAATEKQKKKKKKHERKQHARVKAAVHQSLYSIPNSFVTS